MFLLRMFSHLPFWALYALSDLLSCLMDHVIGYRKAVIDKNLAIAFPEMTEADKKRVRSGFYRHLSDIIVEMVKAISISESDLKRRVPLYNAEVFVEAKRRGLPVMVLGSHQGNWEWLFLGGSISSPIRIDGIYKPLSNKKFDALVLEIRGRFGNGVPIESDKVVRNIAAHRGEVRGIALLG